MKQGQIIPNVYRLLWNYFYKIMDFSGSICWLQYQHILQTCRPPKCNEKVSWESISPPFSQTQHEIVAPLTLETRPLLALVFPSTKDSFSFWPVKFYSVWTCLCRSTSIRKICNYVNRTIHDVYTPIKSLNTPLHFRNQVRRKLQ